VHFFNLNEHAITGDAHYTWSPIFSHIGLQQSAASQSSRPVARHKCTLPQGNLTPVSSTLPVAAATDTVISLARPATDTAADLSLF